MYDNERYAHTRYLNTASYEFRSFAIRFARTQSNLHKRYKTSPAARQYLYLRWKRTKILMKCQSNGILYMVL